MGLIEINNDPLQVRILNCLWRWIINMPTHRVFVFHM